MSQPASPTQSPDHRREDRSAHDRPTTFLTGLLWVQGAYFFITGVWPIIHMESFEWITGEKQDEWLVQAFGAMVAVIAVVLFVAAWRQRLALEVIVLAVGIALTLGAVDVIFVALGDIPPIYLADAVLEVVFLLGWAYGLMHWSGPERSAA